MNIEYKVKNSEELKELEKAMRNFPCSFIPDVPVKVMKNAFQINEFCIIPSEKEIRDVIYLREVESYSSHDSSENPFPFLFVKDKGYRFKIYLKPEVRT